MICDNSAGKHELLAEKKIDGILNVLNDEKFHLMKTIMTVIEIQIEEKNKILKGLEKAYEKLLEYKRAKNSELVLLIDNKIVKIKPDQKG